MSAPAGSATPSGTVGTKKPRVSIFLATACGLGYLPKAPGTFGALAGLVLAMLPWLVLLSAGIVSRNAQIESASILGGSNFDPYLGAQICISAIVAGFGVLSASAAAKYWSQKDPQRVVIDEVSGQHLTLLLGCGVPVWWRAQPTWANTRFGFITIHSALNWKYLLVGFILFRVFDIWKPFPARQAESLPGGWGIMADDWMAGVYAAIGLWIARAAGL
ncbi:MAG TPA: phosphatidylglycerophosphatase A [Candidatus Acidoferrales bacterium]|nr:phosphatidylglycerophosphatase A [Candidatus Acidoferrales bacterium]